MNSDREYVWYVCYGSNLNRERFMAYITGGPIPNTNIIERGCRTKSAPINEKNYILPYELYFAGESARWEKQGVAFIQNTKSQFKRTYGKRYQITIDQFIDVVCQENNCTLEEFSMDKFNDAIFSGECDLFPEKRYGKLICIGYENSIPLITFTTPQLSLPINKPSRNYIHMLALGISNAYSMSASELATYFLEINGIYNNYSLEELYSICSLV